MANDILIPGLVSRFNLFSAPRPCLSAVFEANKNQQPIQQVLLLQLFTVLVRTATTSPGSRKDAAAVTELRASEPAVGLCSAVVASRPKAYFYELSFWAAVEKHPTNKISRNI